MVGAFVGVGAMVVRADVGVLVGALVGVGTLVGADVGMRGLVGAMVPSHGPRSVQAK